jgi:hypothetical protein
MPSDSTRRHLMFTEATMPLSGSQSGTRGVRLWSKRD